LARWQHWKISSTRESDIKNIEEENEEFKMFKNKKWLISGVSIWIRKKSSQSDMDIINDAKKLKMWILNETEVWKNEELEWEKIEIDDKSISRIFDDLDVQHNKHEAEETLKPESSKYY
jgi:hypothetical protein